eukprot:CAMPEP_0196783450 /NCGR_PEP_ID=MMETSP1104-20130614/13757_1 /TAXON_ID=33652 /ORGANISM="Cafeteria sp., Strain Caron Lab Isolate" /LENGTH=61 /DNA_ID=CAMNT_0042153699 /DNA_START=41 /DNA_END=223 /DNA_ORIENTATION=-
MTTFSPRTMRKLRRQGGGKRDGSRKRLDDDDDEEQEEEEGGAELSQASVGPGAAAAFGVNP